MKKVLFAALLACLALFPGNTSAQVQFGLKAGLNVSELSFDSKLISQSNRMGFFAGPTLNIGIPLAGLGVDISALYDRRESKLDNTLNSTSYTLRQQQIAIPLHIRYSVGLGDIASVYAFAGPQFGFNIGDKSQNLFDEIAHWKFSESNLSLNFGFGSILAKHLQLSASYNIACGKTGEITFLNGAHAVAEGKSNSWQVGVAYLF